jgi:hypothetical protein
MNLKGKLRSRSSPELSDSLLNPCKVVAVHPRASHVVVELHCSKGLLAAGAETLT